MPDVTSPFGFPYPENTDLVRDGAQDIENLAEGVNDYLDGGFLYAGTRYYTSSGQFEKADPFGTGDIGLRAIRVRMVGGGGSAAGNRNRTEDAVAGSGGGAAYAESFITDIAGLPTSVTVTRGAGGTTDVGESGNIGGTSSFDALVTANGGFAGTRQLAQSGSQVRSAGSGGSSATGDLVIAGSGGSVGAFGSRLASGGTGGSSHLGGGGRGAQVESTGSAAGFAGGLYGGGGGGSVSIGGDNTTTIGASGGNGIVIVDCFV